MGAQAKSAPRRLKSCYATDTTRKLEGIKITFPLFIGLKLIQYDYD